MRLILLSLLFSFSVIGQDVTPFNDSLIQVSEKEAMFLNENLANQRGSFNFIGKSIGFATGENGTILLTRAEFFEDMVNPWVAKYPKHPMTNQVIILNSFEKGKSGGYDAIVIAHTKQSLDVKNREKLIQRLSTFSCYDHELEKNHAYICPEYCPRVCGCNGITYCNECEANKQGVRVVASGPCSSKQKE